MTLEMAANASLTYIRYLFFNYLYFSSSALIFRVYLVQRVRRGVNEAGFLLQGTQGQTKSFPGRAAKLGDMRAACSLV